MSLITRTAIGSTLLLISLAACGQSAQQPVAQRPAMGYSEAVQVAQEITDAAEVASAPARAAPGTQASPASMSPIEIEPAVVLPRSVTYANLGWTVTDALIDNTTISLFGDSTELTDEYRAARITLRVDNPLSGYTNLDSKLVKLRLGDGQLYEADETGRPTLPGGNEQTESRLIFRLPADATWDDAMLVLSEADRVPAEISLDGDMAAPAYPIALAATGEATVDEATYTVREAAFALDLHAVRTSVGEHFLVLNVRVHNASSGGGGLPLSDASFRLEVDGTPIAPADDFAELVDSGSSYDATVVFAVPDDLSSATLLVGEGDTAAPIALDLARR